MIAIDNKTFEAIVNGEMNKYDSALKKLSEGEESKENTYNQQIGRTLSAEDVSIER